jgi:hypothetical protein
MTGCPSFGEGEIQGLFQDFQGPFSVNSRSKNNSLYSVILIKITNVGTAGAGCIKLLITFLITIL